MKTWQHRKSNFPFMAT